MFSDVQVTSHFQRFSSKVLFYSRLRNLYPFHYIRHRLQRREDLLHPRRIERHGLQLLGEDEHAVGQRRGESDRQKRFRGKLLCFVAVLKFFFLLQVPGLFEGDEFTTLMTQCKEGAQREGLMLDSPDELYKWFTHQVMKSPFKQS